MNKPHLNMLFFSALLYTSIGWAARAECVEPLKKLPEDQRDFVDLALHPFWKSERLCEPVFFIQSALGDRPVSSLLFDPIEIISVNSATRDTTYRAGTDYQFDPTTRRLWLPKGSRIPFKTNEEMHPLMTSSEPKIGLQSGKSIRGIYFNNSSGYHKLQAEVTYTCLPNQWKGPQPNFSGDALPKLMKKLRNKQPVKIILLGDSISFGLNASAVTQVEPFFPAYGELVALALQSKYGSEVLFSNYAISGTNSGQGLQRIKDEKVGGQKPDLVIVAYGMNDVFSQDAETYQDNIRSIMDSIRSESQQTEFILVASMLGNADWGMPMDQFPLYRQALRRLCGQGIVLADLTSIWESLLNRKSFYDLTGNGVNHPNDFGHLVYAQVILSLLIQ